MFDHLAVDVDYHADHRTDAITSHRLFVPGSTLLEWVQGAAQGVISKPTDIDGSGTLDDPYRLGGFSSYVGAWREAGSRSDHHLYFSVAGRTIRKFARDDQKDGFADGFYMADVGFSGTDPTKGTIWNRKNGASYREFGKFIHEGNKVAGLEGVVWSQRIASTLRTVLKGKTGAHAGKEAKTLASVGTGSRWEVDLNRDDAGRAAPRKISGVTVARSTDTVAALPLLSAVMFISEPARNPRAWLMGLMLLDLMGVEYAPPTLHSPATKNSPAKHRHGKHFTFRRAFVHPSRLDDPEWQTETNTPNDQAPPGWVSKQVRRDRGKSNLNKMAKPGSPAVEGLYPPSPKWSGRTNKSTVDVANDYIQAKEVSLLCRWLEHEGNRYLGDYVVRLTAISGNPVGRRNALTATFNDSGMRGFAADLERVLRTELITRRANSFDSAGMLFR